MFAQLHRLCVGLSNALVPAPWLFSPYFSVWFLFFQQFVASFVLCLSFRENDWRFSCDWQQGGREVEVRQLPEEVSRLPLLWWPHSWPSLVFCGWLYFLLLFQEGRGWSCHRCTTPERSVFRNVICKILSLASPALPAVIVLVYALTKCIHYWPAHNLFVLNILNSKI